MTTPPTIPQLSVRLTIEPHLMVLCEEQPPDFVMVDEMKRYQLRNWEQQPTISLTVTSHATQPITIFTWPTIFYLNLSQIRHNFTCLDLTTNTPMRLKTTQGPRRGPFSYTKGHGDEKYLVTLLPEVPMTFTENLGIARTAHGKLQRGHRYRFGVWEGEMIKWWRYGTKDEVMAPPGVVTNLLGDETTAIPIRVDPVEFEVM